MHILKQSNTSGSLALSVLFIVGATGTIIGGHLVDHIGAVKTIRFAFTIKPFLLLAFNLTKSVIVASALLLPIGMLIFIPYSAIVLLGQRYLPNQMGLASGVTLGLAISIGGIATPLFGSGCRCHKLNHRLLHPDGGCPHPNGCRIFHHRTNH